MIVVSDTSPLITLEKLGLLNLLPSLFGQVLIPPEVEVELTTIERPVGTPDLVPDHSWLIVRAPVAPLSLRGLNPGESAAIALAEETGATFLVIDEKAGRRAAVDRGVRIIGTVGILEDAADNGLVNLADAFEKLKATTFRINHRLLDVRLAAHRAKSTPPSANHPPATA
jgi:predicted nucleic acid-binding protein